MSNEKFDKINIPRDIDKYIEMGVEDALDKRNKNKPKLHKKLIKIASISVIGIGVLSAISGREIVFANFDGLLYTIGSFLGIEKDLDDYKTVVNSSITKDGLTVTLNEVILDGDELIVSTTYQSEDSIDEGYVSSFDDIYINGRRISSGSSGGSGAIDSNSVESVIHHDIESAIEGDVDIKIVYSNMEYRENGKKKSIKDDFVFEFRTNGDELRINTDSLKLNQKYELGEDETIVLKEFTSNDVGQKIIHSRDIHNSKFVSYNLKLEGEDDLGNKVMFWQRKARENYGVFVYDNLDGNLDENAKTLTLSLYAAKESNESGQSNNDFKKLGQEFTIELPK